MHHAGYGANARRLNDMAQPEFAEISWLELL
jgi:hypothetical protein